METVEWPSAGFLCAVLPKLVNEGVVSVGVVLELGAGLGTCGMFLAERFGSKVWYQDKCVNARLSPFIHATWAELLHDDTLPPNVGLTIASDCTFERATFGDLLAVMARVLVPSSKALLVHHDRSVNYSIQEYLDAFGLRAEVVARCGDLVAVLVWR